MTYLHRPSRAWVRLFVQVGGSGIKKKFHYPLVQDSGDDLNYRY